MSRAARDTAKLNVTLLFFHTANLRSLVITTCESGDHSAFNAFFFFTFHISSLFEGEILFRDFPDYRVPTELFDYFNCFV